MTPPEILHSQTGLTIKRNPRNSFVVCSLHYTADPAKRSEEWKKTAMAGLSKAEFEQEYEIRYDAKFGERVFPEITARREDIVVKNFFMDGEVPGDLTCWGGFDYGKVNPSSFHVYTVYDGVIYAIWEMYKPCKNLFDFSKEMTACPYWKQIRYIVADPDIFNLKQNDMVTGGSTCVANQFIQAGIAKLVMGNNNEDTFIGKVRGHWAKTETTFRIFDTCPMLIWEFERCTYKTLSSRTLETSNYAEKMVDKNNHALDDCKYFLNSEARPSNSTRKVFPNMAYQWAVNSRKEKQRDWQGELQWVGRR